MITETSGNILDSQAQAIVNTVNCVGVMGKGLALQFKRAYPDNFRAYAAACRAGQVNIGNMFIQRTSSLDGPEFIVNFPTKEHWRNDSDIEFIRQGLADLRRVIFAHGITSIAIPPLGVGNGRLNWDIVRTTIIESLADIPELHVELYAPSDTKFPIHGSNIRMTWGRELITRITIGYLEQRTQSDPWMKSDSITELEIQKIIYFADLLEPGLALKYTKGIFGPYSDTLRAILVDMEGSYLEGMGDATSAVLSLEPIVVTHKAFDALARSAEPARGNIPEVTNQVLATVENFESPFNMELLASVDWVARHNQLSSPAAIHQEIMAWTPRKASLFSPAEVTLAYNHLVQSGLLGNRVSA